MKRSANPAGVCYAYSSDCLQDPDPQGMWAEELLDSGSLPGSGGSQRNEQLNPVKNEVFLCICRSQTIGGPEEW